MASKYKKYKKINDMLAGRMTPPSRARTRIDAHSKENDNPHVGKGKRKSDDDVALPSATPHKRSKLAASKAQTPSRHVRAGPAEVETPQISRKLFSPSMPTSIGPTPHRDGKVLGLFDLLDGELIKAAAADTSSRVGADSMGQQAFVTPCKAVEDLEEDGRRKFGRTPMSSGRRNYLNMFMTPVKPKKGKDGADDDNSLDGIAKMFETPACLKRHQPMPMNKSLDDIPDPPVRLPRKPLGKTLSSIVASLKKMEDEKMDEELDMLREMEAEEISKARPTSTTAVKKSSSFNKTTTAATAAPPKTKLLIEKYGEEEEKTRADILEKDGEVEDIPADMLAKDHSQTLLDGFDDEDALDDDPLDEQEQRQIERDGKLRIFKKGQKRTTRKVNMRPVRAKPPTKSGVGPACLKRSEVVSILSVSAPKVWQGLGRTWAHSGPTTSAILLKRWLSALCASSSV